AFVHPIKETLFAKLKKAQRKDMRMESQVTTVEQSQELIQLGVSRYKASMIWVDRSGYDDAGAIVRPCYNLDIASTIGKVERNVPAFTIADLLSIIPKQIQFGGSDRRYNLTLGDNGCDGWYFYYEDYNTGPQSRIGLMEHEELLPLLCDRIEWLITNEYKLIG
ncbi:MAG: hypothetical protein K2P00_01830, partial [Alistipes sp.]|nr:hypothetical protein [Alistipes sp.]